MRLMLYIIIFVVVALFIIKQKKLSKLRAERKERIALAQKVLSACLPGAEGVSMHISKEQADKVFSGKN